MTYKLEINSGHGTKIKCIPDAPEKNLIDNWPIIPFDMLIDTFELPFQTFSM